MRPEDELVLDALREAYGTTATAEVFRRSLRIAAQAQGLDVDELERKAAA